MGLEFKIAFLARFQGRGFKAFDFELRRIEIALLAESIYMIECSVLK